MLRELAARTAVTSKRVVGAKCFWTGLLLVDHRLRFCCVLDGRL
jgi:hypothetical protein